MRLSWVIAAIAFFSAQAFGHGAAPRQLDSRNLWSVWEFDPLVIVGLAVTGFLYSRGIFRLWHATKIGGGVRRWEAASFATGWFATFVALVSPLHPLGQELFSAHMTQHEILMLISAPLFVLGRPIVVFLWAFSKAEAQKLRAGSSLPWIQQSWNFISNPIVAWLIHLAALWVWHIPRLFEATLESNLVHALQHFSFLFSALLFWWAVLYGRQRALGYGLAVVYMFATALQSGLLGVLLAVSTRIWYPAYAERSVEWGLTPLQDQQLGGLIMWIPAGIVYIIAGLALMAGWLREAELRASKSPQLKSIPS